MPLDITHQFVSAQPDDPDHPEEVQPTNWNDSHALSGSLADTSVVLDGAITGYADGSVLHTVLSGIASAVSGFLTSAFTKVRKNSTGSDFSRGRLNFIEGTNVTITIADDGANDEVDITIAASGGGGGGGWVDQTTYVQLDTGRGAIYDTSSNNQVWFNGDSGMGLSAWGTSGDIYIEPSGVAIMDTGTGFVPPNSYGDPDITSLIGTNEGGQIYHNKTTGLPRYGRHTATGSGNEDWLDIGSQGWATHAFPLGWVPNGTYTTAITLPANGGSIAVPMALRGPMKLYNVQFYNTDTTGVREWECSLYLDSNGAGGSLISGPAYGLAIQGSDANNFGGGGSVSGAGIRDTAYGSSSPIWLPGGIVWLVIRNTSASNTLGIGSLAAAGTFTHNNYQTKTLASYLGAARALDLRTSWSYGTGIPGVVLRGAVFGSSTIY